MMMWHDGVKRREGREGEGEVWGGRKDKAEEGERVVSQTKDNFCNCSKKAK